jgi:riboflavin kinase/FMN adenylyltransferase
MKTITNLDDLANEDQGAVIAIGNFDGVHRGHRALIDKACAIAKKEGRSCGVLTFEPHPRQLFQPGQPPARLTPIELKALRLEESGIDLLISLPFDWDFASQSAEHFVSHIIQDKLGASHVVIGHDFRFGQLRKGDAETIKKSGLSVDTVEAVLDEHGEIISSTRIRGELRAGNIKKANALLGWPWEIQGEVVAGDKRGRELGYPTANILLEETLHPAYGIYACHVQIEGEEEWHLAATNIGIRPMFEVPKAQVEAHLLDFPFREIYGKTIRVRPVQRLRGEAKFTSLEDLITQMEKDCALARDILNA